MTPITDTLPDSASSAMRKAATSLILSQLAEVLEQDLDWMAACRKRIKDQMSDAKHIAFNHALKIRQIEIQLGRDTVAAKKAAPTPRLLQEHQALTDKSHQLQRTAHVCALALTLMDQQAQAAAVVSPKRKLEAVTPPKTASS